MRNRESLYRQIEIKKNRLEAYYARETEVLSKNGIKSYGIGTRNMTKYDTSLKDIQDIIKRLENEIAALEAQVNGGSARRAVGVVPRDF